MAGLLSRLNNKKVQEIQYKWNTSAIYDSCPVRIVYSLVFCVGLWYLTPLSTIFQLYRVLLVVETGCSRRKPPTCRKSLKNFIAKCCIEYTSLWAGFELTTTVMISIDCTGSCKSNYHTITTTTAPSVLCSVDYCLCFFFWPLYCLSFDLLLLITPLVSSNFS